MPIPALTLSLTVGQIQYSKNAGLPLVIPIPIRAVQDRKPRVCKEAVPLVGLARFVYKKLSPPIASLDGILIKTRWKTKFLLAISPERSELVNVAISIWEITLQISIPSLMWLLTKNTVLEQTDTSIAWTFTEQWRVLGRWYYDIKTASH